MALAILESLGNDGRGATFRIDTGTNRYYRLKVGKAKQRRAGVEWIDQVAFMTPVGANPRAGDPFRSSIEVVIPARHFEGGHAYVQLFTFKTADGISPAFSPVELVPASFSDGPLEFGIDAGLSRPTSMSTPMTFQPPRTVPCRTGAEVFATQASIADLIGQVIKVAGPIVSNLLGGLGGAAGAPATGAATGAAAGGSGGPADMIAQLLQTILGALQPQQTQATPPRSGQQSIVTSNRFTDGRLARQFIFGVDDALIAAVAGPVLQVLPQLMNAVNQNRLQMKQQQNNLITNLVSGVNQRLMMDKVLEAQKAGQGTPDLAQLLQMLQEAQAAQPAAAAAPAAPAVAQSLPTESWYRPLTQTSARAVLTFVTAAPITCNGQPTLIFSKALPMQLKVRLAVTGPVPARPLPRAIVTIVFKDPATQRVWFEKASRYTNVSANDVLPAAFTPDELARMPINKPMAVIAEMRWPGTAGRPARSALGSIDIVVADKYFLKSQGALTSEAIELTDMQRFRPFWNKVWEAPTLDAVAGEDRKHRWALNVTAKYAVVLRPDQVANGLMETKVLQGESDPDSLALTVQGRMKAGIELSLAEVNKLLPLWSNRAPLEAPQLQALATDAFAASHAGEFVQSIALKGRAGERGMVWVVPVFQLMSMTLGNITRTDDSGQVLEAADETIAFPLPAAARIIGLKAE